MTAGFGPGSDTANPLAELYHENSKLPPRLSGPDGSGVPRAGAPPAVGDTLTKVYRTGSKVELPAVVDLGVGISDALARRRSVREYAESPVTLWQLGQLLGWAHGVMPRDGDELAVGRSAPSAGALYPIDIYVVAQNVADLDAAVYHYDAAAHSLASVETDGGIEAVKRASLYPEIVGHAGLVLMMVAVFARTCRKYGERGYRFVLLDCGHVSQNLHLVATAIGLGSVGIGGFMDDQLNDVLELDGVNEAVVHTMALGSPRI